MYITQLYSWFQVFKMDQKIDQILVLLHTLVKKRKIVNQESKEEEV